ncbi:MAG TPA: RNB domain-containing ribonuclease [Candidatus Eisenbacteria bacterium]|nr:RNB domain-containing ribonuclease [Candidatus Eisenbacteria bacterium]
MIEYGLEPEFPPAALAEAGALPDGAGGHGHARDLRALPWCSIDNDDSRDLDQLTVAEASIDGCTTIRVAVADVSATVSPGTALDRHARANTTSVYTPPRIFPMLPERLSTDLTSLNPDVDRLAVVIEIAVGPDGVCGESTVYPALVHNHAKLAYHAVGAWLEGEGPLPAAVAAVSGLAENLKLQDGVAQRLKEHRHDHGALELETIEARAEFDGDRVSRLAAEAPNRARQLIEDFMIAANGIVARFLEARRFPVFRRVVRLPERWQRIVSLAADYGEQLPGAPDAPALNAFLLRRRAADPLRFPDLSLTIVKLLGRGEYAASFPGQTVVGHFGLAVSEYTHSTAPNRRYPDLVTQRLVHAALAQKKVPYGRDELNALAAECTEKEDGAQKVERRVRKAAAACLLSSRIGQQFDGVVTGASSKGTWVRVFDPPVEGRVERGEEGLDVGDEVRVRLVHTDPERGFIDFVRV